MDTTNFGTKLSKRLDQLKMGQADLAEAVGVSPQYISDTIRLNRIPGGRRVVEIAKCVGVTAEYLLDDEIPIGAYPGLSPIEEAVLRAARIVGLDEAERRILKAREPGADAPSRPRTDRDWGGDVIPDSRRGGQGRPKSG